MDTTSNAYLIIPAIVFIGVIVSLVWMREKTPQGTVLVIAVPPDARLIARAVG